MKDDRKSWELEWCTRIGFAASYLSYADLEGVDARRVMDWTHTDDLVTWVSERINDLVQISNELAEQHGSPGETSLKITAASRLMLASEAIRLGLVEVLL